VKGLRVRPIPDTAYPRGVPVCRAWAITLPRWLRFLPGPGYAATTIGPLVFVRDLDPDPGLLSHECVHVWQWRRDGWPRFAWRYSREYLCGGYRHVRYEAEARELSGHD
jgi:hypothetical protein